MDTEIKTWTIKVIFHEDVEFDSPKEEKSDRMLMETTLGHLVKNCNFLPRQNDIISGMTGDDDLFVIEQIAFHPHSKIIEFFLNVGEED